MWLLRKFEVSLGYIRSRLTRTKIKQKITTTKRLWVNQLDTSWEPKMEQNIVWPPKYSRNSLDGFIAASLEDRSICLIEFSGSAPHLVFWIHPAGRGGVRGENPENRNSSSSLSRSRTQPLLCFPGVSYTNWVTPPCSLPPRRLCSRAGQAAHPSLSSSICG